MGVAHPLPLSLLLLCQSFYAESDNERSISTERLLYCQSAIHCCNGRMRDTWQVACEAYPTRPEEGSSHLVALRGNAFEHSANRI